MATEKVKTPTKHEVPVDELAEARTIWGDRPLYVKIARRLMPGNKLVALGRVDMTIDQLSDIEKYMKEHAGGGTFRVEVRNPDNWLDYAKPIPPFEFEVDGLPKPVTPREHGISGMVAGLGGLGPVATGEESMDHREIPPAPPLGGTLDPAVAAAQQQQRVNLAMLPAWAHNLPIAQQIAFARQQNPNQILQPEPQFLPQPLPVQAPAATYSSDYLAANMLQRTQAELEKERMLRLQERKELEQRQLQDRKDQDRVLDELRKQNDILRDEMRLTRESAERAKTEAKIEALEMQLKDRQKPGPSTDLVALLTAVGGILAPIGVEVLKSRASQEATVREQQSKTLELQMQGMNNLLQANKGGGDFKGLTEVVKVLGPILLPGITKFLEGRTPAAQAELFSSLAESNLTALATTGQFLQSVMEMQQGDPWWRPLVENGIQSVMQAAEGYALMAKEQAGMAPPAQQQQAPAPIQAQVQPQQRAPAAAPAQQQQRKNGMTPGMQAASLIVNSPSFPKEFRTGQWVNAIAAIHDKVDPERVSQHVAQYLVELSNQNAVPPLLAGVFDKPEELLSKLLLMFPAARGDQAYVQAVITRTSQLLRETVVENVPVVEAPPQAAATAQGPGDEEEGEEEEEDEAEVFDLTGNAQPVYS